MMNYQLKRIANCVLLLTLCVISLTINTVQGQIPLVHVLGGNAVIEGDSVVFEIIGFPAPSIDISVNVTVGQIGMFADSSEIGARIVTLDTNGGGFLRVDTEDDTIDEADGAVQVTVESGPGYVVAGAPANTASVTVEDNDDTPTLIESISNPISFELAQNYPNPFNHTTIIEFSITEIQHVRLAIYNILGQRVRTLLDGMQSAGRHSVSIDLSGVASGTYLYVFQTEERIATKTMVLARSDR